MLPKIGDKVIVWKDGTIWVGIVTNYADSGVTWHSGSHPEIWEMTIEDCDKGKSHDFWVGKRMTFKKEEITGERMFCLYSDEKLKAIQKAVKALYVAKRLLCNLFEQEVSG